MYKIFWTQSCTRLKVVKRFLDSKLYNHIIQHFLDSKQISWTQSWGPTLEPGLLFSKSRFGYVVFMLMWHHIIGYCFYLPARILMGREGRTHWGGLLKEIKHTLQISPDLAGVVPGPFEGSTMLFFLDLTSKKGEKSKRKRNKKREERKRVRREREEKGSRKRKKRKRKETEGKKRRREREKKGKKKK